MWSFSTGTISPPNTLPLLIAVGAKVGNESFWRKPGFPFVGVVGRKAWRHLEWERFHVCMAVGKRAMRREVCPGARLSCRPSGEMNVLALEFRWKNVGTAREGWARRDEWASLHHRPPLHQEPEGSNDGSVLVTPKPLLSRREGRLMTNEVYPWQPGLKHYFGCQPSHHAAILQRGVTHRSQCLLRRLIWLEVLSRTSIFVLFLLHSWTAGSALWQPLRKAQHGLRVRESSA